jgi:uncharacterized phage protein gp47/JayE
MSDAQSGLAHLCLKFLSWLALQLMPDTAETEWLDRFGEIWLTTQSGDVGRKRATLASGSVEVTGRLGVVLPLGTQLQAPDGYTYETTQQVIIGAGQTIVTVIALDTGALGNLGVGAEVSIVNTPQYIDSSAHVVTMAGGADDETDDELRARVLRRIQQVPQGGAAYDYEAWALEMPGVTRAWCNALEMGIGTSTVRFMMDELRKDSHGIPLAEDVERLKTYVDSKRPVAVKDFFLQAPIPFPINLTIRQLVDDSQSTRAAIEQSLSDMLFERAAPGAPIYRSWVGSAISEAIGEDHHELDFVTQTMPTPGHLAILGSIVYAGV